MIAFLSASKISNYSCVILPLAGKTTNASVSS
jgi:hypothetical protein